jgi:hypothetical protein
LTEVNCLESVGVRFDFLDSNEGRNPMEWTLVNLIVQTVAGLVGSNVASAVAHEHRFGFWGRHSLVRVVSGRLGGLVLQEYACRNMPPSWSPRAEA